ncbi:hypothetical protein [Sulfurimonas denitrificans]|nr:hypothetical protein [Sulfurimonas denitrificans]MDD3441936.1 hypothetical protein [Sulfurimonas denitrificans]
MLVWLFILLIVTIFAYVAYRFCISNKKDLQKKSDSHYTFKI